MPSHTEIMEALRNDAEFQNCTDAFLLVCLVIAHGRQQEARGVEFSRWLDHIEAMLGEYA